MRDLHVVHPVWARDGQVHAGRIAENLELITEDFLQARRENCSALAILRTHAAQVSREMPFVDELREHRLSEIRLGHIDRLAHGEKAIEQVGRDHHVADAHRGKEHLAERPDIDHARVGIEPLEGRDGTALVAILAVVIVLDDPGTRTLRPLEEFQTSPQTHGPAQRKLMRWRDERHAGAPTQTHARRHIDALAIDRDRHDLSAVDRKHALRKPVARIFHPHAIAWIEQCQSRDLQCLLRSVDDQDLLRLTAHSSRRAQIGRERLAQIQSPTRQPVLQRGRTQISRFACDQSRPDLNRELIVAMLADGERALALHPRRDIEDGKCCAAFGDWTQLRALLQRLRTGVVREHQLLGQ